MALTMTRTRTQTALTKLAELVANVHGELAFVESLRAQASTDGQRPAGAKGQGSSSLDAGAQALLQTRHQKLLADRDALYATVRQFDPELAPENIGAGADWKLQYGRRGLGERKLVARYLQQFIAASCALPANN